jgi:hypothetical protein
MNPNRTALFQIRECFRLAHYRIDGERLYSNAEIAAHLGACPAWVADVLGASFDRCQSMKILEPNDQLTNMTYDSANFNRPPTPDD